MNAQPVRTNGAAAGPAPSNSHRAWAAFVRQELMSTIDALVGLGDLLGHERREVAACVADRPRGAGGGLGGGAGGWLAGGEQPPGAGLGAARPPARHDLGNRLNQISGMVQLLQMQEEALSGAFMPDLEKILG